MIAAKIDRWLWRVPKKIPPHGQTLIVEVSDGALRIRDSGGAGYALVFLCDPPVTVEAYDEVISAFSSQYRVVVVELPHFGFSRMHSAKSATFAGAVRTVEEALKSLNLEACILIGPCISGFVAAELVQRGELRTKGLVLLQTPDKEGLLAWVERMDPKRLLRTPLLGQLIVRFFAKRTTRFWVKYATASSFDADGLACSCVGALEAGAGYPLATMLQLWGHGTRDANLTIKGLAVWGSQDRSHRGTEPHSTRKHLPTADVIEVANCGHFIELEQPEEFADAIMPFVRSCFDHD